MTTKEPSIKIWPANLALLIPFLLTGCATDFYSTVTAKMPLSSKPSSITSNVVPTPVAPPKPEDFAFDLIALMGASPSQCGAAAKNSPQVNWTCAQYSHGLSEFIAAWDKLVNSAEVSNKHTYSPTSDWMYFEVDGEIDFFWKTYSINTTQALIAYDPSEKGNELIIGLNPVIGDQFAVANGSHRFISTPKVMPIQE